MTYFSQRRPLLFNSSLSCQCRTGRGEEAGGKRERERIYIPLLLLFPLVCRFQKSRMCSLDKNQGLTIYESKYPSLNPETVLTCYYLNSVIKVKLPC